MSKVKVPIGTAQEKARAKIHEDNKITKGRHKEEINAPTFLPFQATLAHAFLYVGGVDYAIEAARILAETDEKYKRLVYLYDHMTKTDQKSLRLEDLCAASEIQPRDFLGNAVAIIWERNIEIGKLIAATSHPKVVEATVKAASKGDAFGMPDRKMLLESAGFLPQRPGMQLHIDQSKKILNVNGNGGGVDLPKEVGPGLPSFEERSIAIAQAVRGDESATKLLPAPKPEQAITVPGESDPIPVTPEVVDV